MKEALFYSTNDPAECVNFETALLTGMASKYGLYMIARSDIPVLPAERIIAMKGMSYAAIAYEVLEPFLGREIPAAKLKPLLDDAYDANKIPTIVLHITGKTYIMWPPGTTYSFKD